MFKGTKHWISAVLAVFMLLSMLTVFVLPALAEPNEWGETVSATGLKDVSNLPDIKNSWAVGTKVYKVTDRAGLEKIAELVADNNAGYQSLAGYTFYQANDIDMSEDGISSFTPIGTVDHNGKNTVFKGTFDGNGFVIENLYIFDQTGIQTGIQTGMTNNWGAALFGRVNAELRNIGIASGLVIGYDKVGSIAGNGDTSRIYNCWNAATVVGLYGGNGIGGIAGRAADTAKLYNCYNLGLLICLNSAKSPSGIHGWVNNASGRLENCYSLGEIVAFLDAFTTTVEAKGYQALVRATSGTAQNGYASHNFYSTAYAGMGSYQDLGSSFKDAGTGLPAEDFTNGNAVTQLNSYLNAQTGKPYAVEGYTVEFVQAEEGFPALSYKTEDGTKIVRKPHMEKINVMGSVDASLLNQLKPYFAHKDGKADASNITGVEIATADDLFLLALLTICKASTVNPRLNDLNSAAITFTDDIDMDDLTVSALNVMPPLFYQYFTFQPYTGTLDGQGHVIKNINIYGEIPTSGTSNHSIGLIAYTRYGAVKNIGIEGGTISALSHSTADSPGLGSIVGCTASTTVYRCWSTANLVAKTDTKTFSVGGLVGRLVYQTNTTHSSLDSCFFAGTITRDSKITTGGGLSDWIQDDSNLDNTDDPASYVFNSFDASDSGLSQAARYRTSKAEEGKLVPGRTQNCYSLYHPFASQAAINDQETVQKLKPEAYGNGELAGELNANYNGNADGLERVYYTTDFENEKTIFGDETNQTCKLTVRYMQPDGETLSHEETIYKNAGDTYEIPEGYVLQGDEEANSVTVQPDDSEIVLIAESIDIAPVRALKEQYDSYAKNPNLFADEGASVLAVWGKATEFCTKVEEFGENINDPENQRTLRYIMNELDALVENVDFTLKDFYPYYPVITDYDVYSAFNKSNSWAIATDADWRKAVEMSQTAANPILAANLHLLNDVEMNTESVSPLGFQRGGFTGLLDGHGYAFKNLHVAATATKATNENSVGLIALVQSSGVVQNLGIDEDSDICMTTENNLDVGVASFAGCSTTARFYKLWSDAKVTAVGVGCTSAAGIVGRGQSNTVINGCYYTGTVKNPGTRNSGLNAWAQGTYATGGSTNHSTHYNSFFSGTLDGYDATMISYNNPFQDRTVNDFALNIWSTNGVDLYWMNPHRVGGENFDKVDPTGVFTAYNNAHRLTQASYSNGELAWNLNNEYHAVAGYDRVYYTLSEDGKTVFGDETNMTRRVTLNYPNRTDYLYVNNGGSVTLPQDATYELADGTASLDGFELTDVQSDVVLTATPDKVDVSPVENALEYFGARDTACYAEGLDALIAEIESWLENEEGHTDEQVSAYVAALEAYKTQWTSDVEKLPKAAERDTLYPGAPNYTIRDTADLVYVQNNAARFTADNTLYVANDFTLGEEFTNIGTLSANIDGRNHTITGGNSNGKVAMINTYSGSFIKDLTLDGFKTTKAGYGAAILISSLASSTATLSNVTLKNCSVSKPESVNGTSNRMGGLIAAVTTASATVNIVDCAILNCQLNLDYLNSKTGKKIAVGNAGFVIGQLNNSVTANVTNLTMIGNSINTAVGGGFGTGILFGAIEGKEADKGETGSGGHAVVTNVAAFGNHIDLSTESGWQVHGLIAGVVMDGGSWVKVENLLSANNTGSDNTDLWLWNNDAKDRYSYHAEQSAKNVWMDRNGAFAFEGGTGGDGINDPDQGLRVGTKENINIGISVDDFKNGKVAYEANQVVGQKWYLPEGAEWPTWTEDDSLLPVKVTFTQETDPEQALTKDIFYTNGNGVLIDLDGQLETVIGRGEWDPAVPADRIFTEDSEFYANLVEKDENLKLAAASLTLYDNLAINFKVDESVETSFEDPFMVFRMPDGQQIVQKVYTTKDQRLSFECRGIDPDQLAGEITIVVYGTVDGTLKRSKIYTYSVAQYCENMLEKTQSEAFKTLLADLLGYGQEAYKYTHAGETDATIARLLEAYGESGTAGDPVLQDDRRELDAAGVVTWNGVALSLSDRTAVRVTVTVTDGNAEGLVLQGKSKSGIGDMTTRVTEFTQTDENQYTAVITGLGATQLRELVELSIWRDGKQVSSTYQFSVVSYADYVVENSTAEAALVKSLIKYGDAAFAYAESKKQ